MGPDDLSRMRLARFVAFSHPVIIPIHPAHTNPVIEIRWEGFFMMNNRRDGALDGLRLLLWGVVLFLLIAVCALVMDDYRPSPTYARAVMVWGDEQ